LRSTTSLTKHCAKWIIMTALAFDFAHFGFTPYLG